MHSRGFLVLLLTIDLTGGAAVALELPTATDLKAAYCGRVLARQIELGTKIDTLIARAPDSPAKRRVQAQAQDVQDRHRRLLAYLGPRLKHLDAGPLVAAAEMADADEATNARLSNDAGCAGAGDVAAVNACVSSALTNSPAREKQRQCDSLEWLPF
jgi:hypothetical protein